MNFLFKKIFWESSLSTNFLVQTNFSLMTQKQDNFLATLRLGSHYYSKITEHIILITRKILEFENPLLKNHPTALKGDMMINKFSSSSSSNQLHSHRLAYFLQVTELQPV